MLPEYIKIGLILRPYKLDGTMRVEPLTDDAARFEGLSQVYLKSAGKYVKRRLESSRALLNGVYIRISGVNSPEEAERLRGEYVYVHRSDTVALPEGSYLICELTGCEVADETGRVYGKVSDVFATGANDVYVITGEREWLMPALKSVITDVDTKAGRITVDSRVFSQVVPDAD